jgi:hypothetical protein
VNTWDCDVANLGDRKHVVVGYPASLPRRHVAKIGKETLVTHYMQTGT